VSAQSIADVTEKDWQTTVKDLVKRLGWRRPYHTFDSRRSEPGFPDLVLVRDRVVFLELKRETGKLSAAQTDWLTMLIRARAEVYIARPSDFQALAQVLGRRYRIRTPLADQTLDELDLAGIAWENEPP
jgi:hypothetical protein